MTKNDKKNMVLLYVLLGGMMAVAGGLLWVSRTVDEMGTLSNAAYLAGYDWVNGTHTSGDYYYKYGTVLFYALPFCLIKDSIVLYRVLMIINGLVLGVTPVCAYRILRKHLKVTSEKTAFVMALIAAGTPAALLHSNYGRGDFVLVLTPWLAALFLLEAYATRGKRKVLFSGLAALSAVYAYMSHTRGIVLVLAVLLTVVFCHLVFRIRLVNLPAYLLTTAAALVVDKFLTAFFKAGIWVYGAGHAAAEAVDIDQFRSMLTVDGIKVILKSVMGWCFTIFTSTAGLICVGLVAIVVILVCSFKKAVIKDEEKVLAFLGIMNFCGSLASGILFFYPYLYASFLEGVVRRGDRAFYERYMAGSLGVVCMIGLYMIVIRKDLFGIKSRIVSFAAAVAGLFGYVRYIAPMLKIWELDPKMVISLYSFNPFVETDEAAFMIMGIFSLAVFAVWMILMFKGKWKASLAVILSVFMFLTASNYYIVRYRDDQRYYNKVKDIYEVMKDITEVSEEFPYVFVTKTAVKSKVYQVLLKEFQIGSTRFKEEYLEESDLFIICKRNKIAPSFWDEHIYQFDDFDYENGTSNVIYVKGERLYQRLTEMGVGLTKAEQ